MRIEMKVNPVNFTGSFPDTYKLFSVNYRSTSMFQPGNSFLVSAVGAIHVF